MKLLGLLFALSLFATMNLISLVPEDIAERAHQDARSRLAASHLNDHLTSLK